MRKTLSLALVGATILASAACASADGAGRLAAISPDTETDPPSAGNPDLALTGSRPLPRFRLKKAMHHVRRLAARIGVRVRATRGERRGITYTKNRLRDLGYNTDIQKFSVDSRRSRNVVAWWPGSDTHPLVVGAHIDSVPRSPGANDNASGVAVMLEMARIFADRRQGQWLRFVGFGSEEYGRDGRHHVGSAVYVRRLRERAIERSPGMISIDMIADGRPLITGTAGIGPPRVARAIHRKLDRAGFAVDYRVTCDCSDNGPFERAGIPAAFVWSGLEPNYHDPSDTPRRLKKQDLRRTGKAMRTFLRQVDRGMIRYLRGV